MKSNFLIINQNITLNYTETILGTRLRKLHRQSLWLIIKYHKNEMKCQSSEVDVVVTIL